MSLGWKSLLESCHCGAGGGSGGGSVCATATDGTATRRDTSHEICRVSSFTNCFTLCFEEKKRKKRPWLIQHCGHLHNCSNNMEENNGD